MSKEIFKNITNSIEIYEKMSMKTFKIKIELFRKLLELVGDKEDKYYEEFFDNYIKEFKLKKNYGVYFNRLTIINLGNFKNIYDFIEIIKDYYNTDFNDEIMNLLDNIFITPPSSPKPIEPIPPSSPKLIEPIPPSSPKFIEPIHPSSPKLIEPIPPSSPKLIEPIPPSSPKFIEPIPPSSPKPIEPIPPSSPKSIKPILPHKPKKPIPIALKIQVWDKCIGLEIGKHKCLCCKTIDIIQMSFHCGHVIPECKGGETILSNLKPICQTCNLSMGTKNMDEFMKKFQ